MVRSNCERLLPDRESWLVLVGDVMRYAEGTAMGGAPFGIVFLDPPYAMPAEEVSGLVRALGESGQLTADCVVVYERAADAPTIDVEGLVEVRTRAHGTTSVDLFRMEGAHG
jgi:16S rRNA (guanine966-N2)-methyltransferase